MPNHPSKFEKMLRIFELLDSQHWTKATDLARALNVDERTVFRYTRDIMNAFPDFPVLESGREGYRLVRNEMLSYLRSSDDLIAVSALETSPFGKLARARKKTPQELYRKVMDRIEARAMIPEGLLKLLFQGLMEGRQQEIIYIANGKETRLSGCLLRLVSRDFVPYVLFLDQADWKVKTLAVNKIESISPTRDSLPKEQTEQAFHLINSAWGIMINDSIETVTLEVSGNILPYFLKSPLHPSQKVLELENATASISLPVHNIQEFNRFILRFGRSARITKPEKAGKAMMEFLTDMMNWYQK